MILIFAYLHIWPCIGVSKWLVLTSFNHAYLQYPIKHHHDLLQFLLYENCWIYLSKNKVFNNNFINCIYETYSNFFQYDKQESFLLNAKNVMH